MPPTRRDFLKLAAVGVAAIALPITATAEPLPSFDGHFFVTASDDGIACGKLAIEDGAIKIMVYEGIGGDGKVLFRSERTVALPPDVMRSVTLALLGRDS